MRSKQLLWHKLPVRFISYMLLFCALILFFTGLFTYTRAYVSTPAHVEAATSSTINFQARLSASSGQIVADGNYSIQFKLYNVVTGGSDVWSETQATTRVVNGYLTVNLGSANALPTTIDWSQEHWLTMNVNGDGEMTPRLKLTAVPYAFSAGQLRKTLGASTSILDFLNPTGNRTINLPDQSGTLCIQGSPDCVDVATTNDTAVTSSNSGLEISADGLRLLGGCADTQVLRWNETTKLWGCASSSSSIVVRESDGTPSTTAETLEFGPATSSDSEFIVTNEGSGVTRIRIGSTILTTNNYATTLDTTYVNEGQAPTAGDVSGSFTAGLSVNSVQNNSVDLGIDTVGNYVASLGTLVGLTTSGNSGEGSTPGLSVAYGSSASTAVQGNTTLTCASGTGDLSGGGGGAQALGGGITCGNITISEAPVFDTSVTSPIFKNGGGLLTLYTTASAGADDIIFSTAGTEKLRLLENGTLVFGTGANSANFYLSANDTLKTDDKLVIGAGLSILGGGVDNASGNITNAGSITGVGANITGAGALTVASGASGSLTLDSASDTIQIAASDTTLQRNAAGTYNIDLLNAAGATTLSVNNSDATQVANLSVEGDVSVGAGKMYKVGASQISSANLSNDANLAKLNGTGPQTFTGNNKFSGTLLQQNDSATAFRVQNAAGSTTVLTVDTVGSVVIVGSGSILRLAGVTSDPATPVAGDLWYNSTQKSHRVNDPIGKLGLVGLLYTNTAPSNSIVNTTTETNFNTSTSIPANALAAGKVIRVTARGVFSTQALTAPTLNLRTKFGTTVLGTTGNVSTAASLVDAGFKVEFIITANSIGTTGAMEGQGTAFVNTSVFGASVADMQNATTITVNTTLAQTLQLSAQWGTANAANTITLRQVTYEVLN